MSDSPFGKPLATLQREYEDCKQELRNCIDAWHMMPETFPWQRHAKENQRRYCCQILDQLRQLAPDSPEVHDREAELGGCPKSLPGG